MGAFRLILFGLPELRDPSGVAVRLRTHKQLALLVYLALAGRVHPVSREALAELLWPGVPTPKARHSLSQGLSAIRGALGDAAIRCIRDTVLLDDPLVTDLDREWSGEDGLDFANPLRELERAAGADFSTWVDSARQRCLQAARVALARSLDRARASGDLRAVHERAAILYAVDPTADLAAHALAERELLRGDTAEAILLLRRHLDRTQEQLGCTPNPDLKRLLRRIESGHRHAPGTAPPGSGPVSLVRDEVFIGREAELAQLEALWTEARSGVLRTCLVTGAAGIGKTSLVRSFAVTVNARGAAAVVVECQEIGAAVPFAAAGEIVKALSGEPGAGATDPEWLAEAAMLHPGIRSQFPGAQRVAAAGSEPTQQRTAECLYRLVEAVVGDGPVLLVIDDVQHLDPASYEVAHRFGRYSAKLPMLIVATRRTTGVEVDTADAARGPYQWDRSIHLKPMVAPLMEVLVANRAHGFDTPAPDVVQAILRLADGNPYAAETLLSDWCLHQEGSIAGHIASGRQLPDHWQPPDSVRIAFARQSAAMSADAADVLALLAVAGRAMALPELCDFLGWGPGRIDRTALELIRRGVIRTDRGDMSFKNELYRAFVYYSLSAEIRTYYHTRIAASLLPRASDYRMELHAAHHLARSGQIELALRATKHCARMAMLHGGAAEAERAIMTVAGALGEADPQLVLLHAEALSRQGKYRDALQVLSTWSSEEATRGQRAHGASLKAEILMKLAATDSALAPLRLSANAVAAARVTGDPRLIVEALQLEAEALVETGSNSALRRIAREMKEMHAKNVDPEVRALVKRTEGFCLMVTRDLEPALQAFADSGNALRTLGLFAELRRVLNGLGICCTALGRLEESVCAFEEALLLSAEAEHAHMRANLLTNLGVVHLQRGLFSKAAELVGRAVTLCRRSATPITGGQVYPNAAWLAIQLGNFDQASDFLEGASESCRQSSGWLNAAETAIATAEWHLAKDEKELAWPIVEALVSRVRSREYPSSHLTGFERLRFLWIYQTSGPEALRPLQPHHHLAVAERLEALAVRDWALGRERIEEDGTAITAFSELQRRGLFGVISGLVTVGVAPRWFPERRHGESGARVVGRVFPEFGREEIPDRIPVPL